jgi:hypothetical protein
MASKRRGMGGRVTWRPYDPCVCGCGVIGWKTTKPLAGGLSMGEAHVVGCSCRHHTGKRNRKKGQAAQAKAHRALGGQGFTPTHEESGLYYDLTVRPEVKTGQQIPASFRKFIGLDWTRRALSQSERAIAVGIDARASICIDGRWLVVDLKRSETP